MPREFSYLPSIIVLGSLFSAAVLLTVWRPRLGSEVRRSGRFLLIVGATILFQLLHFLEEWYSGFYVSFPRVFSFSPMGELAFVGFNVLWLVIWTVSLFAVRRGVEIAACPLWFLGLGMVLNLFAHPLLALQKGGYFPGLLTSPFVGLLGIATLHELSRLTAQGGGQT